MVGSCTNGSWHDMASVAGVVRGRRVHPSVSFVLFPGSHRILETMAREGLLADLLAAGRHGLRVDLRLVRGHRPRARRRHQEPARVQPQLPGAQRREGRRGLSLLVGGGGGLGADRRHHRSAHARRRARRARCRRSSRPRWSASWRPTAAARSCAARTSSRCRWASRWPRRSRRRCCSSSATRSRPTTSRRPARRPRLPLERAGHRRVLASSTSTPSSWRARRRPGAASSWAARPTARAPRARWRRWRRCTSACAR